MIRSLSGDIYNILEVEDIEYNYDEIKTIFTKLNELRYYTILKDDVIIFNNLYDELNLKYINTKLNDLTIVFLQYNKEDCDKIKYKYSNYDINGNLQLNYKSKTVNNLKEEFNLSVDNLDKDRIFMLYCINLNGGMLSYASDELKNDIYMVYCAYNNNTDSFKYASDHIKNNNSIIIESFNIGIVYKYCSLDIINNKELTLIALKYNINNYRYIGDSLKSIEFIYEIFNLDNFKCSIINYFTMENKNNKNLIMRCIETEKNYNEHKIKRSKNNNLLNKIDLKLSWIGHNLQYDNDIILECVKSDGIEIFEVPDNYVVDKSVVIIALTNNFTYSKICCDDRYIDFLNYLDIIDDKEIVLLSIKRHGNNFQYASERLRNDIEVVKEAINNCYNDNYDNIDRSIVDTIKHIKNNIENILKKTSIKKESVLDVIIDKIQRQVK